MENENLDETAFFSPLKTMSETSCDECEKKDASTQYECEKENLSLKSAVEMYKSFERDLKTREFTKLKKEDALLEKHLSNIFMALTDVHQKYNRTKSIIEEHKGNIKKLESQLNLTNERIGNSEQYIENSRKLLVDTLNKYNKDYIADQETYENKMKSLMKTVKVLDIKMKSLQSNIDQVTTETNDLGNLLSSDK